jgi:hypothetical protein
VRTTAELKTKLATKSVDDFLNAIEKEQVRRDCWTIAEMMQKATKAKPQMWGPSIVGFGHCRYKYPDGREMDWMVIAFSPRKHNITVYLMPEFEQRDELLAQLGKHSRGKGCVYIKRLSEIHLPTLKKLIERSVQHVLKPAGAAKSAAARGNT